eukprot:scaffold13003_cov122-Amphora_coffeaeformis.AAC.5
MRTSLTMEDGRRKARYVGGGHLTDVWYRDAGHCYEFICTYVDDLLVAMKEPSTFMDALQSDPYNYKLKGVGPPRYHLGGDFFKDPDGTLCYGCQTYIRRMADNYKQLFGEEPKTHGKRPVTPLTKGDQPELDNTEPCTPDETAKFQSLIGALQWTISLCPFDIGNAVMTLSRYRVAPLIGHLDRAKQITWYLCKYPQGAIRFRTGIPNYKAIYGEQRKFHDWMYSIYGTPQEGVPEGMFPPPKGKLVRTSTFVDANLMHDLTTGRSCTGILHLINQTPIDWFTKRQSQVESATYGSEFMAACQATEQIIDLHFTLCSLGVPIDGPSWMFGDNQSVVKSSTIPHFKLSKHWNALSYQRVHKAITGSGITSPGHETPLASGVSTNVSVDVDSRQYDSEVDVHARQHDPEQDQDQPAFNRLWNNQYAVLTEMDM